MRRSFLLLGAGTLLLGVLAAAGTARADGVDDLAKALDVAGAIPGVPVTGQDVRDSRSLFQCIDKAGDDVAIASCLDAFKDTSVGKKAWSQTGLPSWFLKLIDVYIDVREGDFWGLVKDAGYVVACAIANVVFTVDVCGIAQAILETIGAAKELLSDVAGFLKDLGSALMDFLGLGGSSGPPLWQVVFNEDVKPHIGAYADDWLEKPATFKAEFDVTGNVAQSLVCKISQSRFGRPCAWLFGHGNTQQELTFVPLFRGDTIKAIKMGEAAAVTQAIATVGKKGQEWAQFRHDWLTERAPQDRLRKAYGVWGPAVIMVNCLAAAEPWKQFLSYVNQPEVKPEAEKALGKVPYWSSQTTLQFCEAYENGLKAETLKQCVVVGTATEKTLKLDCDPGSALTACQSADSTVGSTRFAPPFDLQCATHALKMSDQKPGTVGTKPPVLAPTPVKPVGMPQGPSPK